MWKNDNELYELTDGSKNAIAYSVFVADDKVYTAGYENNGTKDVAKLWKNKSATDLTDGSNDATASSIFVAGSNVYTVGHESNGTKYVIKVWKKGSEHLVLTNGSNDARARSIKNRFGADAFSAEGKALYTHRRTRGIRRQIGRASCRERV